MTKEEKLRSYSTLVLTMSITEMPICRKLTTLCTIIRGQNTRRFENGVQKETGGGSTL